MHNFNTALDGLNSKIHVNLHDVNYNKISFQYACYKVVSKSQMFYA